MITSPKQHLHLYDELEKVCKEVKNKAKKSNTDLSRIKFVKKN